MRVADCENPILVAPGEPSGNGYAKLYETVIDVLDDDFELKPTSRYSGQIETFPRVAPGYEQPWKGGSPDIRERLLATKQTSAIKPPCRFSPANAAAIASSWKCSKNWKICPCRLAFREPPCRPAWRFSRMPRRSIAQAEVMAVEASGTRQWIPQGRDFAFEQKIIRKIRDRVNRPDCLR